jgi:hypothetical protein
MESLKDLVFDARECNGLSKARHISRLIGSDSYSRLFARRPVLMGS